MATGWLAVGLIFVLTIVTYLPAMRGDRLWDDQAHITREELRSADGLLRIWLELGATQQYYPLLHTAFWIEQKLWGDTLVGYHLTNVLLQASAASLVYAVVRKLQIPGALLAALVFALHPVHVESVAWIAEQKNTLSAVFYLSAMWAYLEFDQMRWPRWYWLAFGLFVLGLLTKTVTATLPAALLVIFWWQRGNLDWRRDVRPLAPFFVLGAIAGLVTAWVERTIIGAEGAAFEMSFLERGLLAGRVPWFYLSKLLWPLDLMFIYPRWQMDAGMWWQWLFPLATIAALIGLWLLRRRTRAPLAGALFFVGTLFPVLGFLNVYPFQYSFVADHFQYLASLGVIVPVSAAIVLALRRWLPNRGFVRAAICAVFVLTLSTLTRAQCAMYRNAATLYETTIARNPDCWLAYLNLGAIRAAEGQPHAAIELYKQVLRIKPNHADAHANLGVIYGALGDTALGDKYLQESVRLAPDSYEARYRYGVVLLQGGRADEAARELAEAARLFPQSSKIQNNWGVSLFSAGRLPEATRAFQKATELDPEFLDAYDNLVRAQMQSGDTEKAIVTAERALGVARATGQTAAAERIDAWLRTTRASAAEQPRAD